MGGKSTCLERKRQSRGGAAEHWSRFSRRQVAKAMGSPSRLGPELEKVAQGQAVTACAATLPDLDGDFTIDASIAAFGGVPASEIAPGLNSVCLAARELALKRSIERGSVWNYGDKSAATRDAGELPVSPVSHLAIAPGDGEPMENTNDTGILPDLTWLDPEEPRATLVLPIGVGGGGFVSVPYRVTAGSVEWRFLELRLQPSKVYVVQALRQAYLEDRGLSEGVRGRRRAGVLADMIAVESGWQLSDHAVRAYMCDIERLMQAALRDARKQAPAAILPPLLIERQKGFGARLAVNLEIRDLTHRPQN